MKKKILRIISPALCMALFLSACGGTASEGTGTEDSLANPSEMSAKWAFGAS